MSAGFEPGPLVLIKEQLRRRCLEEEVCAPSDPVRADKVEDAVTIKIPQSRNRVASETQNMWRPAKWLRKKSESGFAAGAVFVRHLDEKGHLAGNQRESWYSDDSFLTCPCNGNFRRVKNRRGWDIQFHFEEVVRGLRIVKQDGELCVLPRINNQTIGA